MLTLFFFIMTPVFTNFHRFYPESGERMENRTSVTMKVYKDTLFVQAKCHSKYGIYTEALDRDELKTGEDFFGIILTQDRNTGYFFMVNARGIKEDGAIVQRGTKKKEWDYVWDVNIKRYDDSLWIAGIKIPIDRLNFEYKDSLVLYINLVRSAKLKGTGAYEAGTYVPIVGSNFYDLGFTKKVAFTINHEKRGTKLFIEPYVAIYRDESGVFFKEGEDITLKSRLGEISITANPEYATVESNIERFNLNKLRMMYYLEKRPFFMHGFELWNMPFQVLYTRSILDIDGGIKANVKKNKMSFNTFLLEEKDTVSDYISTKRLTGGIRGLYSSKYGQFGIFYLRSRDSFEAKGGDLMFYLPLQFRLNMQYTGDRTLKSDVFIHFFRYVRPGVNVEGGFERLDSVNINTAYAPYPLYTRSMWLYLTFNFAKDRKILPYYAIGIGGTHGEYLNGKLYENNGTLFATLGILNNLSITYNLIPWRRYAEWNDTVYDNLLHYMEVNYQPIKHHYIDFETQIGRYFGGTQKYYSVEYSYKGERLRLSSGYGYNNDPFYTQKRIYLKAKYNITNALRLRLFAQRSDISNKDEINFLTEYRIKPGTFLYLVINRQKSNGTSRTQFMIKFKSYAGI